MLVLCLVAAAVAPWLLPLVFGPQYSRAAAALWGLLPSVLAYSIVSVLSQYLVARHYPWTVVLAWVAGLAAALLSWLSAHVRLWGGRGWTQLSPAAPFSSVG